VNLCIDGAYITQAVQTFDNSVPLVAGRDALLRVFVRASGGNAAQPSVRVRFYNGSTLVNTFNIAAPSVSVPTAVDESVLTGSWNAVLTGSLLQPGLRMLVDVDPANAVVEANEGDNTLPANGTPAALDVRTVAPINVRLVPVVQSARGDTARVDNANKTNFITPMMRMFPVATINADVRAPYTYTGPELVSGGGNWNTLLSEMNALRVSEASGRAYYGIVRVGYTSGVAGLGYIGVPTAIGWDYQPSGTEVMAHEMGHNFGRLHAPCGNPAGVDGQYPYSGATIGSWGYDILAAQVKSSGLHDLMSYCDPPWISDYTYKGILNFRASNPMSALVSSGSASAHRGLLVWGRIDQGRVILEPAIEVDAPPALPARGGPHRVEAFGPRGEALFSLSFSGDRVADSPDPNDETFAFVVPFSQLRGIDLDRLRLSARGRAVEQRGTGGGAVPTAVRTARGVRVSWNPAAARMALIRDARTGEILSFSRTSAVDLRTTTDDLEITLSDGVKSVRSRIRPK
jgi:peptidase M66-like protein